METDSVYTIDRFQKPENKTTKQFLIFLQSATKGSTRTILNPYRNEASSNRNRPNNSVRPRPRDNGYSRKNRTPDGRTVPDAYNSHPGRRQRCCECAFRMGFDHNTVIKSKLSLNNAMHSSKNIQNQDLDEKVAWSILRVPYLLRHQQNYDHSCCLRLKISYFQATNYQLAIKQI